MPKPDLRSVRSDRLEEKKSVGRLVVVQGDENRLRERVTSIPPAILSRQSATRLRVVQMIGGEPVRTKDGHKVDPELEFDEWFAGEEELRELQRLSLLPTDSVEENDVSPKLPDIQVPALNPLPVDITEPLLNPERHGLYSLRGEQLDCPEEIVSVVQIEIRDNIRNMWQRRYLRQWWNSESLAVLVFGQLDAGVRFMDKKLFNEALEQILPGQVNVELEIDSKHLCAKLEKAHPGLNLPHWVERKPRSSAPPVNV